jgi:pyrrolysyl-tRNA synthetase-like protein
MAEAKRYYRKRQRLLAMAAKIKLWPSRQGRLHGIKSIVKTAAGFDVETHSGHFFSAKDSKTSRAARWLRAKQYASACPMCKVPQWKLDKYGNTVFVKKHGAVLKVDDGGQATGGQNGK